MTALQIVGVCLIAIPFAVPAFFDFKGWLFAMALTVVVVSMVVSGVVLASGTPISTIFDPQAWVEQ